MPHPSQSSAQPCREADVSYNIHTRLWASPANVHSLMRDLERMYPHWFHAFDRLDPCACALDDMQHAMATAPDPFLAGMVYGMLVVRTRVDGLLGP